MLVTNSIKNDLAHKNQFIVGLALCSLGNLCTAEMARDVAPEVSALLGGAIPTTPASEAQPDRSLIVYQCTRTHSPHPPP